MQDAVVPNNSALKFIREVREKQSNIEADPKDKALHQLSEMPGWKDLKEYINNLKESLKPELDMKADSDEDMFRSYGMRMILYELASEQLDNIIQRVEDASNEIKEIKKTT